MPLYTDLLFLTSFISSLLSWIRFDDNVWGEQFKLELQLNQINSITDQWQHFSNWKVDRPRMMLMRSITERTRCQLADVSFGLWFDCFFFLFKFSYLFRRLTHRRESSAVCPIFLVLCVHSGDEWRQGLDVRTDALGEKCGGFPSDSVLLSHEIMTNLSLWICLIRFLDVFFERHLVFHRLARSN